MVIYLKPMSHEWRPHSVPTAFKKSQIAEVRAVQTPATLWKRYGTLCNRLGVDNVF